MENEMIPDWQFNVLPGNANQGAILTTISELLNPPFNASNFKWVNMEELIGVANMKLEYDETENIYKLYKAKGHRLNNGEWVYDWIEIGAWETLTEETAKLLRSIVYFRYDFVFENQNNLKIYGIRKDGTQNLLCDLHFATYMNLQNEIERATNEEVLLENGLITENERARDEEERLEYRIENEIERATNKENEIEENLNNERERAQNKEQEIENKVDNIINDTTITNDRTWSSEKISQEMSSALHYKGQVATVGALPAEAQVGDFYNVEDTGDNYCWDGSRWDKLSGEYINGHGILINGKTISARGQNSKGIDVNANGIGVKIDGTSVKFDSQGRLYVDPQQVTDIREGDGVVIDDDNTINVKVDGTTVGINSNNELINLYKVESGEAIEVDSDNKINLNYNSTNLKVVNNQLDTVLQIWNGTQTEYDALTDKDANTLYLINEEI